MDLFGTAGIRGRVGDDITPELAVAVGRAVAAQAVDSVVVGHDGRTTSPGLADAVAAGVQQGGATVVHLGQVPTPALAWATHSYMGETHGVMITASHNPPADNGIKCVVDGQEYDADRESRVAAAVESPLETRWEDWGGRSNQKVLRSYRQAVAEYVLGRGGDGTDCRVVVDCGNGMASVATPQVLGALGADPIALNATVDGTFPARGSKPTPETLTDLQAFVAAGNYDCAIAHDGDADRVVLLDGAGDIVHEDTVLAILAEHYVRESAAEEPVVITTPNASGRVDERVRAGGGTVERTALGTLHEGIARVQESPVVFAGEPWKHIHPPFGGWIDGVASAALLVGLIADAGSIADLTDPVTELPYRKVSLDCPDDQKGTAMETVRAELPEHYPDPRVDTDHGLRLDRPDGSWVLVRPSGTEPKMRIYAEGEDVDALVSTVREVLEPVLA